MKTATQLARERIEKIQKDYLNQLTFGSWNNSIYWFLQIIMIFFAMAFIGLAMVIPLDPISFIEKLDDATSVKITVHNDNIAGAMILMKLGIFVAGLGFLFAVVLCSKVRKRNSLLIQAKSDLNKVCDELV